jgi:hypothetical protein
MTTFNEPVGECRKSGEESAKPRLDLVPYAAVSQIAEVLTFGAAKYGDNNWCRGARWGRYFAALQRHVTAWWGGEELDPETGKPHLAHAGCCLLFLMEYQRNGWGTDDRFVGPDGSEFKKDDGTPPPAPDWLAANGAPPDVRKAIYDEFNKDRAREGITFPTADGVRRMSEDLGAAFGAIVDGADLDAALAANGMAPPMRHKMMPVIGACEEEKRQRQHQRDLVRNAAQVGDLGTIPFEQAREILERRSHDDAG